MTGYPLQKDPIYTIEKIKPHYEESENYQYDYSHGEKDTEH